MSDLGDDFRAWKEHKKEKKQQNMDRALDALFLKGITLEWLSSTHGRYKNFDYWPSTGLFIDRNSGKRGRGIANFLREALK